MDLELEPLEEEKKNPFESHESAEAEPSEYNGPERRVCDRRSGSDRRGEVRFEGGKEDRRSGRDQRKDNITWDDFHST
jgi:hypothetical protein